VAVVIHRWLLMEIGCLECHWKSRVVGTYATHAEAEAVAKRLDATGDYDTNQRALEIFDLEAQSEDVE
jgi:hypothetical protein